MPPTVLYRDSLWAILAEADQFGIKTLTLAGLPRRAYADEELKTAPDIVSHFVDAALVEPVPSVSEAVTAKFASSELWLGPTRKAQLSLHAWFLIAEDPQRRLIVRDVAPLMHQVTLVEHVLADQDLSRVLIGDEVGLGKTVEAGLITQRLVASQSDLRVLYLAPARLVRNVTDEFRKLGIDARRWISGPDSDARIESDRIVIASINKAVHESNAKKLIKSGPWDLIIADECHHLSDWAEGGGSPNAGYRLVRELLQGQRPDRGRLLLMSGTPHQGNQIRFENILELLRSEDEGADAVAGRVIYRTKEMVRDWDGRPLFPRRDVRQPRLATLGDQWGEWYERVGDLYDETTTGTAQQNGRARAGGWAKGQALQWAASSVDAGLGFLVRLAIRRLRWDLSQPNLVCALEALRPYRGGPASEPLTVLYDRLVKQIGNIENQEDAEDLEGLEPSWQPNATLLAELLTTGSELKHQGADAEKWRVMVEILREAGNEKVVLFCQPVETVAVVARHLEAEFGVRPSIIVGGQTDSERADEIDRFRDREDVRFIVSSRAGGEGLNLQISRRLLHLDIPWNPMDLEQRVGRVHRFGSRQTILVDTIVVPNTREAHAYRIARSKLKLISEQLDPSDFEMLFSRVMNLVPPEELASIFGISQPWTQQEEADQKIASIVRAGYEKLTRFTSDYSEGAKRLQALRAGSAEWHDVRLFLKAACSAKDAPNGTKPIFSLENQQIVESEAAVHTVHVFDRRYVCDETDGLPCHDERGAILPRLGTNSRALTKQMRERFLDARDASIGSVRLSRLDIERLAPSSVCIAFFAMQQYSFASGSPSEQGLDIYAWSVDAVGTVTAIQTEFVGDLIRLIVSAERLANPTIGESVLAALKLIGTFSPRHFRGDEASAVPAALWPIGCFLVSPS